MKKIILIILLIFLLFNVTYSNNKLQDKNKYLVKSSVIPGWGHYCLGYKKESKKIIISNIFLLILKESSFKDENYDETKKLLKPMSCTYLLGGYIGQLLDINRIYNNSTKKYSKEMRFVLVPGIKQIHQERYIAGYRFLITHLYLSFDFSRNIIKKKSLTNSFILLLFNISLSGFDLEINKKVSINNE